MRVILELLILSEQKIRANNKHSLQSYSASLIPNKVLTNLNTFILNNANYKLKNMRRE